MLLPLTLFQIRTFRIGFLQIYLFVYVAPVFLLFPLMLQIVFHYSAEITGWPWFLSPLAQFY